MADHLARVKVENVTNQEKSLDSLLANEELLSMQQVAEKLDLPITRAYDLLQDRKFMPGIPQKESAYRWLSSTTRASLPSM